LKERISPDSRRGTCVAATDDELQRNKNERK
jgi:hypothetical protein